MVFVLSQRHVLATTLLLSISCSTAFLVQPSSLIQTVNPSSRRNPLQTDGYPSSFPLVNSIGSSLPTASSTTRLSAKLWQRLEIEEDEEPMWYLLNCIAGLEIDLLRQCRQRCEGMEDVVKFVVPIQKETRSHGPNRMVTDIKVRYQGYVFGKLRLSEEVYEAIQDLDLCRSWMGTVNKKGYKKLPPTPLALNEDEIENFGLEDLVEGIEDDDVSAIEEVLNEDGVILDTAETDQKIKKKELKKQKRKPKVDEEQLQQYIGLCVDDMVKVTGNNKFKGEDGVVKRLKGGEVKVRFYTYGSMYEEWLAPTEVRKMSEAEVLRGLSGPTAPVSQDDFEGNSNDKWSNSGGPGGLRDALGNRGRNTRQGRNEQKFRQKDMSASDERKNWDWYQNEKQSTKGGPRDYDAGSRNAQNNDVDGQWGRFSKRQEQRDRRQSSPPPQRGNPRDSRQLESAVFGNEDWSAFVSTPGDNKDNKKSSTNADDDFFNSLMAELNTDEASSTAKSSNGNSNNPDDDDSFFSSLMAELNDVDLTPPPPQRQPQEQRQPPPQRQPQRPSPPQQDETKSEEFDFFAALEAELKNDNDGDLSLDKQMESNGNTDDFFAKLENELKESSSSASVPSPTPPPPPRPKEAPVIEVNDDFFASLEKELADLDAAVPPSSSSMDDNTDDFFANLESVLEAKPAEAPVETIVSKPVPTQQKKAPAAPSTPKTTIVSFDSSSLEKKKVPELKEMLKERGLKVGGKKADLIERLMQ